MSEEVYREIRRIAAVMELQTMLVITMAKVIKVICEDRTPDFKELGLDLEQVTFDMDMAMQALERLKKYQLSS